MSWLFLVNDPAEISPTQTTAMLIEAAARDHEVYVCGVDDLSILPSARVRVRCARVSPGEPAALQRRLRDAARVERDGEGLTELEFVLAMVIELGMLEWDQVRPFIKQARPPPLA